MKILTSILILSVLLLGHTLKRNHSYTKTRWWLDLLNQKKAQATNITTEVARTSTTRTRATTKVETTTPQIFNLYRQVDSKRLRQNKQQKLRKQLLTTSKPNFEVYYPDDLRVQAKDDFTTSRPYFPTKRPKSKSSTVSVANVATTTSRRSTPSQLLTSVQKSTESVITTPIPLQSESRLKSYSSNCQCSCWPVSNVQGNSFQQVASDINAQALFTLMTLNEETIPTLLGVQGSYTFFLPTNDAFCRLSIQTIDRWRNDKQLLQTIIRNHVVVGRMPLDELQKGGLLGSNLPNGNLRVNNNDNETLTVNGGRIAFSDLTGPLDGIVHVIDGVLFPIADKNLLHTIEQCNKYDGFLSLVKVAELSDILTDDGPFTIFLPTNDALSKMSAEDASLYKTNKTALKEFLLYHMVYGAYFSSDLKDGHYLETGQQGASLRVSIRVDGCQRRLVEVNSSPLHQVDIPASNGVIHILDWALSPNHLHWCDSTSL